MTEPAPEITLTLSERTEGSFALRPVGIRPYILLEVDDVTDDSLSIAIEVGGGTPARPVADLALFLSAIADQLGEYTAEADVETVE